MLERMAGRLLAIAPLLLGGTGLLAMALGGTGLVLTGGGSLQFVGLGLALVGFGALIEALRRLARAVELHAGAPGAGDA